MRECMWAVAQQQGALSFKKQKLRRMSITAAHLDAYLGEGAFSWVYALASTPYALKIAKQHAHTLDWESQVLQSLAKINNRLFPQVLGTGTITLADGEATSNSARKYLLMERLGVSLEELISIRGQLSVGTIREVGRQVLAQLRLLGQCGLAHNDIKPANLLFGLGEKRKQAFLVDFGFAATPQTPSSCFRGSLAFAASSRLRGDCSHSLNHDLESLVYVLLWTLNNGALPWSQDEAEAEPKRRAVQILAQRQQLKEITAISGDKRGQLASELVGILRLLHGQQAVSASQVARRLEEVL